MIRGKEEPFFDGFDEEEEDEGFEYCCISFVLVDSLVIDLSR